ncbi:hypothetical protein HMPREF6485_1367 [Segatella buccae ATCC 33574]|uniref:Uncharacterized protein n=1 Tax=Segatella buccae ATCC 33574 TaxID=873513 RepID=E6K6W8_9BACT|nr:hypothetical protein HMPREF6485_1367 [Segatella buccae ATCC 33574]
MVVVATTKVQIFKQITTVDTPHAASGLLLLLPPKVQIFKQITTKKQPAICQIQLLLLPQRYKFSSKSQHHLTDGVLLLVVVATTKVQIFKQITTPGLLDPLRDGLLLAQKYTNNSINPNLRIHILSKRMVAVPMY